METPGTAKEDIFEIERRLETSGRPSAVVMTMIVALQKGTKLPEMRTGVAPHRDYGEIKNNRAGSATTPGKDGSGKEASKKEASKKDQKNQDRDRDRDKDRDRDRDR